ncbi:carboxynorspermidine decarboxylase [Achromatium sp. WMS2]|nr:carboxynorspermidine decarboxylase [Achromatium sp. WMS2]
MSKMKIVTTPYYLIDEARLKHNLKIIQRVRLTSGAKSVLALKCFSTWGVFELMRNYLDGTTSSSLFEARLGYETFGKEVHAYSVGFAPNEIKAVRRFASKVIFNSVSQLVKYRKEVRGIRLGLRVNPGVSYSHYDLANPARRYSRLGVCDIKAVKSVLPLLSGLMLHFNCENDNLDIFSKALGSIEYQYGNILEHMEWVSLGGGLAFTKDGYPLEQFSQRLKQFAERFGIQVYLEPGEAAITNCAELVTTVVDVVHNELDIAIVDASVEAHMLDHLIYRTNPQITLPGAGKHKVIIAGRSCLAGDVFGEYQLQQRLKPGTEVRIGDAAGYTMVKKNWFNGLAMPSIVVRRLDGTLERVKSFSYKDFKRSLS